VRLLGPEDKTRGMMEKITSPREGVKENNKKLDAEILRREPPDEITRDAPWYQRRYFATLWSTVKAWLQ
jgi:hypothetical protein